MESSFAFTGIQLFFQSFVALDPAAVRCDGRSALSLIRDGVSKNHHHPGQGRVLCVGTVRANSRAEALAQEEGFSRRRAFFFQGPKGSCT